MSGRRPEKPRVGGGGRHGMAGASTAGHDPDRISYTVTLRALRRPGHRRPRLPARCPPRSGLEHVATAQPALGDGPVGVGDLVQRHDRVDSGW